MDRRQFVSPACLAMAPGARAATGPDGRVAKALAEGRIDHMITYYTKA